MFKKTLLILLSAVCLVLSGCSSANEYNLSLASDGSEKIDYIYYNDETTVYVVGGIMMAELEDESVMLETALADGDVLISDILSSAAEDAEDSDVDMTEYPDGSVEYHYDSFVLVNLRALGTNEVYFLPTDMGYYNVIN